MRFQSSGKNRWRRSINVKTNLNDIIVAIVNASQKSGRAVLITGVVRNPLVFVYFAQKRWKGEGETDRWTDR